MFNWLRTKLRRFPGFWAGLWSFGISTFITQLWKHVGWLIDSIDRIKGISTFSEDARGILESFRGLLGKFEAVIIPDWFVTVSLTLFVVFLIVAIVPDPDRKSTSAELEKQEPEHDIDKVLYMLRTIRDRIISSDYVADSYVPFVTGQEKEEILFYMGEIANMGLGPRRRDVTHSEWNNHIDWIIPRIEHHGLKYAKVERDRLYK